MTDAVTVALIISVPTFLTALAGLISSIRNGKRTANVETKVSNVEIKVDGKMDELIALTKSASRFEGREEERTEERARNKGL